MHRWIELLKNIPLYLIKMPFGVPIYLNILMPLMGIVYYLREMRVEWVFLPFFIILAIGGSLSLMKGELMSFARTLQLVAMIGFTHFLMTYYRRYDMKRIVTNGLILFALFFAIEIIFFAPLGAGDPHAHLPPNHWPPLGWKGIIGHLALPLYSSAYGEPNFAGLILMGFTAALIAFREYRWLLLSIPMLFLTASRGAMLGLLATSTLLIEPFIYPRFWKLFCRTLLLLLLLYPLAILVFESTASDEMKLKLQSATGRYVYQITYVKMGIAKPIGTGYFLGKDSFPNYVNDASSIMRNGQTKIDYVLEPHNLFIQVWSDFGIIGYLLFAFFLWRVFERGLDHSPRLAYAFLCVLISLLSLNGLSEFILYYFIALLLKGPETSPILRAGAAPPRMSFE